MRTVHKRRLIMPAKMEAADGIRKMLGWDKSVKAGEPEDDITELLVMIRRRSSNGNALQAPKAADAKPLLQKTESTQVLKTLSSEHLEPIPISINAPKAGT